MNPTKVILKYSMIFQFNLFYIVVIVCDFHRQKHAAFYVDEFRRPTVEFGKVGQIRLKIIWRFK